ncbi:MAG: hypothetical protein M3552_02940 [Planctomycetota bacterium]|nr:hypothetical protein [Planctomycetaceae bacterium]MDQ3329601.1 hypothetical protein [Planctomycetota bacterium]
MSAYMMTATEAAYDERDVGEMIEWIDSDEEMSVVRTPKMTLIALLVAAVAGAVAYQQSPTSVDARDVRSDITVNDDAASLSFQQIDQGDRWASTEVATMVMGLDG